MASNAFLARARAKWEPQRAARLAQRLDEGVRRVCYLGNVGETLPHPVSQGKGTELIGRSKCLQADLVVVEDLARLHDCSASASVPHILAILARGLPVVTLASWRLAQGDPALVPPQSIIRHRPLAMTTKHVWEYDALFQARESNLAHVIGELCAMAKSNWLLRGPGVAKGRVGSGKGSSAHKLVQHQFVQVTGVDVVRTWIQEHRRIENRAGSKAWSLTGPIL